MNFNLADEYKKIYIYKTRLSTKHTLLKQNLSTNLCLSPSQFV